MSNEALTYVWKRSDWRVKGSDLCVLVFLADQTRDKTGAAWPAIETIASAARLSESAARRAIQRLQAAGIVDVQSSAGRRANVYRIAGFTPSETAATLAQLREGSAPAPESPTLAQLREGSGRQPSRFGDPTLAQLRDPNPIGDLEIDGKEGKTFSNDGGGETRNAAANLDAILAEIPPAILDAWRQKWPITVPAAGAIRNAIRAFSAEETATAIEIMLDSPKEITRPAAYMKKVLQRRVSAIVDAASAGHRPPAAEPTPDTWQEIANATAAHRPQPVTAGADDAPAEVEIITEPIPNTPPAPLDDHAAEVQAAFDAILPTLHPATAAALAGAICTNGDGYTVHVSPSQAAMLPFIERRALEIRNAMHHQRGTLEQIRFTVQAGGADAQPGRQPYGWKAIAGANVDA